MVVARYRDEAPEHRAIRLAKKRAAAKIYWRTSRGKEVSAAYKKTEKYRAGQRERKNRPEIRKRDRLRMRADYSNNTLRYLWYGLKPRSRKRGLPCSITLERCRELVPTDNCCPYCGAGMKIHTRHAPSIDEIVPGVGYVDGNVDIICRSCNIKKQNATMQEHLAFASRQQKAIEQLRLAGYPVDEYISESQKQLASNRPVRPGPYQCGAQHALSQGADSPQP
jgi:rubredoxin